jgi:hypothetical protein
MNWNDIVQSVYKEKPDFIIVSGTREYRYDLIIDKFHTTHFYMSTIGAHPTVACEVA